LNGKAVESELAHTPLSSRMEMNLLVFLTIANA
jgi:hypothetical protein